MTVIPEFESHVYKDQPSGNLRYALSFKSNIDRTEFLKSALRDTSPATSCKSCGALVEALEKALKDKDCPIRFYIPDYLENALATHRKAVG